MKVHLSAEIQKKQNHFTAVLVPVYTPTKKILFGKLYLLYRFWGLDNGDLSDCGLLGSDTVHSCKRIKNFRKNILPPASELNCVGWRI